MIIKGIEISNYKPIICVPIVSSNKESILEDVKSAVKAQVPMIEWRIDFFDQVFNYDLLDDVAKAVSNECTNTVFLMTFRSKSEGGQKDISSEEFFSLVSHIALQKYADLVDVEYDMFTSNKSLFGKMDKLKELIEVCHDNSLKVILSHHNFSETPSRHLIKNKLYKMNKTEADIVKIALMPNSSDDVDRLLNVTKVFADSFDKIIITMSMGQLGRRSRIQGSIYGSAVTFASLKDSSAPGQVPYEELLDIMSRNIYLVGFMGCGKTTLAKAFQKQYGLDIVDMDDMIVEKTGMSIPKLFEEKGQDEFRKIETGVLEEISQMKGTIVSCGGGAVLSDRNIQLMKESGKVVLLIASPETVFERVKNDNNRPLLNGKKNPRAIKRLMDERMENYEKAADFSIDTEADLSSNMIYILNRVYI